MILMIEMMIKTISTIVIMIVRIIILIKSTIEKKYADADGDELPLASPSHQHDHTFLL